MPRLFLPQKSGDSEKTEKSGDLPEKSTQFLALFIALNLIPNTCNIRHSLIL